MIPKIDPDVKYIGSSKLRDLTAAELRALTGAIVVQGAQNTPLAVILPYQTYLKMQESIRIGDAVRAEAAFTNQETTSRINSRSLREKGDGKR